MSNSNRLTLPLERKIDSNGKIFFIAKLQGPLVIDCSKGICLFVFTSDLNEEEIQIADLITKPRDKDV